VPMVVVCIALFIPTTVEDMVIPDTDTLGTDMDTATLGTGTPDTGMVVTPMDLDLDLAWQVLGDLF
jgi:hypothetical protein